MGFKFSIVGIISLAILSWFFFSNKTNNEEEKPFVKHEKKAKATESSAKQEASLPSEEEVKQRSKSYLQATPIVSLKELSGTSNEEEVAVLFQRISAELINELKRLENTTDSSRITSRLNPIVNKLYYLGESSQAELKRPQGRLPEFFQDDIKELEQLWTDNPDLARTADGIFTRLGLLQYEHIPYQLRQELAHR